MARVFMIGLVFFDDWCQSLFFCDYSLIHFLLIKPGSLCRPGQTISFTVINLDQGLGLSGGEEICPYILASEKRCPHPVAS